MKRLAGHDALLVAGNFVACQKAVEYGFSQSYTAVDEAAKLSEAPFVSLLEKTPRNRAVLLVGYEAQCNQGVVLSEIAGQNPLPLQ